MPKNFFQDMVVAKRQSRGELAQKPVEEKIIPKKEEPITPPVIERKEVKKPEPKRIEQKPMRAAPSVDTKFASVYDVVDRGEGARRSRRAMWYVAGASLMFLLFALSFAFSGAQVTIDPKVQDTELNQSFSGVLDGGAEQLAFDLIALSGEESREVQGGAEKDVANSARGTVIIYNNFSSAAQNLDINTRLEGSNGKIYKTEAKTTVPGMKGSSPGSVEVKIYASEPGEEYNSEPLDFTILGFKGTPKYSKFYARSKGDITGGFTGKIRVVSEEEKNSVYSELRAALETELLAQATSQIPSGFILFKDAAFLSIDAQEQGESTEAGMVPLTVKGTLYGFLFEEKNLTREIAEKAVAEYDGSPVFIPNIRDLVFTLGSKDNASFKETKNISFNLSGAPKVVWNVDEEKVRTDILGKNKKEFQQIMSQYQNINLAELSVRPFWKRSIPEESKDLKIVVNYPQ